MALTINTNVESLNAQRNLAKSQGELTTSMQRLSSGLRINSAKDDAAGLAISDRMTAQIRGLDQATRNANDGISLAQTAEGAMQESTNNLQRIRELAVQAANGTNSLSDRQSLQAEVEQLLAEMDRIAQTTSFNGLNILNGQNPDQQYQVGPNPGDLITFNIDSVRAQAVGHLSSAVGDTVVGANEATDITIAIGEDATPISISPSSDFVVTDDAYRTADSAYAKAAAITDSRVNGLIVSAETTGATAALGAGGVIATNSNITDEGVYSVDINGVTVTVPIEINDGANDGTVTAAELADVINQVTDETGVTASYNSTDNTLELTASDGANIAVENEGVTGGTSAITNDVDTGDFDFATNGALRGTITMTGTDTITLAGTTDDIGFGTTLEHTVDATTGVDEIDITTFEGANLAILRVDSALSDIDASRGELGAIQNRFESTISNLMNVSENLTAARSRIRDADIAQETSAMTKANILQQAGVSILTQANQTPQLALQLLQG